MSSKNKNNMSYEERIETMKENLGLKFTEEAKKIISDCKVIKGEDAEENFNKELNDLTFEIEEIYALDYEQFKEKFPNTIKLIKSVGGSVVTDSVKKGLVLQGWALETNVNKIIENTGARELKQRLTELTALHGGVDKIGLIRDLGDRVIKYGLL